MLIHCLSKDTHKKNKYLIDIQHRLYITYKKQHTTVLIFQSKLTKKGYKRHKITQTLNETIVHIFKTTEHAIHTQNNNEKTKKPKKKSQNPISNFECFTGKHKKKHTQQQLT